MTTAVEAVVIDSIDLPIMVIGCDFAIATFNQVAANLFSLAPADVGRPVYDIPLLSNVTRIKDVCADAIVRGVSSQGEVRDAAGAWFVVKIAPYKGGDHPLGGAVLTLTNVTALRASLEQAVYEREYAKAIVNTLVDALAVLNDDLQIQTANQAFFRMFQVSREESQGARLTDLGTADWATQVRTWIRTSPSANGPPDALEVEHEFPTIGRRIVLLNARRLVRRGNLGQLTLLSIHDITERKQAEEALRRSEARYRGLYESIDEGFCIVKVIFDQDGKAIDYVFLEVNRSFEKQTGIEDARGRSMRAIAPEHEEHWFGTYGKVAMTGESVRFEHPAVALKRYYEGYAYRVGDPEEQRVAIIFNDITARKQAEDSLKDADRRKDEFLAMLAHELRNPLAPITMGLHLIRAKMEGQEEVARPLAIVSRQTEHLTKLVGDLLEVSRISLGKIRIEKERLDVAAAISRAVEISRPLIDSKEHHLTVALPHDPLWVDGDVTRLAQVLGNLLNNAAKYTDRGGQICVAVRREGSEVVFRVSDNGVGIPKELMPRLFDLFTQADSSLDRSQGGLGIGLTLVRRLVELHEGSVEASSEGPGKGSEFIVRLPAALEMPRRRDRKPTFARLNGVPPCRIVIVEDNLDAAEILGELLTTAGHEVNVAHDGPSALEVVRVHSPSFVLLDIGLPGMDGYEVARQLRREHGNAVTLIALTGYGQEEDRRRTKEAGFDHHLVKPLGIDTLSAVLAGSAKDGWGEATVLDPA